MLSRFVKGTFQCCAIFAGAVTLPSSLAQQQPLPLDRAKAAIQMQSIKVSSMLPHPSRLKALNDAASEFSDALTVISAEMTAATAAEAQRLEARDLDAKLRAIAWHRKQNPEPFKLIGERYIFRVEDEQSRAPRAACVAAEHATVEYRYIWEYYVLSPIPEGAVPGSDENAIEALSRIHADESLIALKSVLLVFAHADLKWNDVKYRHYGIYSGFAGYRSEQALRTMLECYALSSEMRDRGMIDVKTTQNELTLEDHLLMRLSYEPRDPAEIRENGNPKAEWLPILNRFPQEGLTERQSRLLGQAKTSTFRFPRRK